MLEHPAYSPDLAPSDFFPFLKIKEILIGMHFDVTDDINGSSEGHYTKPVPKLFGRVDLALASVHSFPRGVL